MGWLALARQSVGSRRSSSAPASGAPPRPALCRAYACGASTYQFAGARCRLRPCGAWGDQPHNKLRVAAPAGRKATVGLRLAAST